MTTYSELVTQIREYCEVDSNVFTTTIINATSGQIRVGLTTSQTAVLKPGRFMYDVLITDSSGEVTRVLEGAVLVREGVTK